jgi:hypothetical protein
VPISIGVCGNSRTKSLQFRLLEAAMAIIMAATKLPKTEADTAGPKNLNRAIARVTEFHFLMQDIEYL